MVMIRHKPTAYPLRQPRRGATIAMMPIVLTFLLMVAMFSVDLGRVYVANSSMHNGADAAAMAGALALRRDGAAAGLDDLLYEMTWFADQNAAGVDDSLNASGVEVGVWNFDSRTFTPATFDSSGFHVSGTPANAVRATLRRTGADRVGMSFGQVFQLTGTDVMGQAMAAFQYVQQSDGQAQKGPVHLVE